MRRAAIRSLRLLRAEAAEATPAVSESLRSSPAGLHQAPRAQLSALTRPLGQRYSSAAVPLTKPAGALDLDDDYNLLVGHTELHRKHHQPPVPAETGGPLAKYEAGLATGQYRPDPRQRLTIQMLQELYDDLQKAGADHALANPPSRHKPRRRPSGLTIVDHVGEDAKPAAASTTGGWFTSLFNSGNGNGANGAIGKGAHSLSLGREGKSAADAPPAVRGLYMYGGVGCGKTMLMDVFVHTAPAHFRVLRTHFHDFMLEVHAALRKHSREADPLLAVADGIAARCRVLALDELFVTDVADAMILNRLFGRLWERGVVLVATSNRPPDDLYKGGLQRNLFMPFIHRLKNQCRAHDMASGTDYRRLAQHQRGLYFVQPTAAAMASGAATAAAPCAETAAVAAVAAEEELAARFKELTAAAPTAPARIEVAMGRHLEVPLAAGKACMFSFGELCGRPVAAADYLALSAAYHTLALQGVPTFGAANRSEAYRFVTLIDVLYEARTRLLVTAAAPPVDLFKNIITPFDAAKDPELASRPDVVVDDNLGFAKDRTISRLTEMQSLQYLLHHARQHEPSLVLALEEAFSKKVKAAKFAGH